jgi:curved DNA-binding protein CbpA
VTDYYELLQISPHADAETVRRVYRFLAGRFHPDNPVSGDANLFCVLNAAYEVLSDPTRRAEYNATRRHEPQDVEPLSSSVDFMDNLEGELNRRLALLAVLYHRRRTRPDMPEVELHEIESRMGFPRDYLDFTIWYLVKKGYVARGDSAQCALTAEGVDFVEKERGNIPVLNKLLTSGSGSPGEQAGPTAKAKPIPDAVRINRQTMANSASGKKPMVLLSEMKEIADRRVEIKDRCVETIDRRDKGTDRRVNPEDRRKNQRGRRSTN